MDVLPEEDSGENFVVRHWRGHLSLAKSWFLVGGVLSTVAIYLLVLGVLAVQSTTTSLRVVAATWLGFFAIFLALRVWALVGIWRSAGRHQARGGSAGWAHLARGLLVVGVLASVAQAKGYGLQVLEYGSLAFGQDSLGNPAVIEASADRKEIKIAGMLVAGTADRFSQLADSLPDLETVHLESPGGRIFEAQHIAQYVKAKRLDTRVEGQCESACTLVLLAGQARYAPRIAQIGFHQPDFPGLSEEDRKYAVASNAQDYVTAGISRTFVNRMMQTPASQMWYPDHDELIREGVLSEEEVFVSNNPSNDPLGKAIIASAAQINRTAPAKVDEITQLLDAQANGHELVIRHKILIPVEPGRISSGRAQMTGEIQKSLCSDPAGRAIVQNGGNITYRYITRSGDRLFDIPISDCA